MNRSNRIPFTYYKLNLLQHYSYKTWVIICPYQTTKFKLRKSLKKNNMKIIFKCNAYLPSLTKTPVKFQKDWDKIVGGVVLTRYLMSVGFCSN